MPSLLIKNAGYLVTMNSRRQVLHDAWILLRNGIIVDLGVGSPEQPGIDEIIDAKGGIVLPGLINTHHHMFQNLARAFSPIANLPLLPWLSGHLPLWLNLTRDDLRIAGQVAMIELMLSGCTTTVDHHYIFPKGDPEIMDALFEAAALTGIRFHGCRGAMDLATEVVSSDFIQDMNSILSDFERVYQKWHDPSPGSFNQVAFAPCGLFGVTGELLRKTADLAAHNQVRLHTHCGETREEDDLALQLLGARPLDYFRQHGWEGNRIWIAHGIHFGDKEIRTITKQKIGVAHCPCSNMRLGSGVCRVQELRRGGSPVSLGVDGSASNDSGHLLNEARQALLLARVMNGAGAMTVEEAFEMATLEGARNLGREDEIGSLEPGKNADIAIFPESDLWSSGAENRLHALLLCFPRQVSTLIVHGEVRILEGQLLGVDLPVLLEQHEKNARRLLAGKKIS
jgi:8-oxoguanine deaminase